MTNMTRYVRPVVDQDLRDDGAPVGLGDFNAWGHVVDYSLSLTEDEREGYPSPCLWWAATDNPCLDCPSPAAPNHHLCNRCHERRAEERAEANEARACARMDGEREMPRGLMWGDE